MLRHSAGDRGVLAGGGTGVDVGTTRFSVGRGVGVGVEVGLSVAVAVDVGFPVGLVVPVGEAVGIGVFVGNGVLVGSSVTVGGGVSVGRASGSTCGCSGCIVPSIFAISVFCMSASLNPDDPQAVTINMKTTTTNNIPFFICLSHLFSMYPLFTSF